VENRSQGPCRRMQDSQTKGGASLCMRVLVQRCVCVGHGLPAERGLSSAHIHVPQLFNAHHGSTLFIHNHKI
jgi:hypothetical protein